MKNKKKRRLRNQKKLEEVMALPGWGIPRDFKAKVRSGDALEVSYEFSGIQVPYDPENPGKGLEEKTKILQDLIFEADA